MILIIKSHDINNLLVHDDDVDMLQLSESEEDGGNVRINESNFHRDLPAPITRSIVQFEDGTTSPPVQNEYTYEAIREVPK